MVIIIHSSIHANAQREVLHEAARVPQHLEGLQHVAVVYFSVETNRTRELANYCGCAFQRWNKSPRHTYIHIHIYVYIYIYTHDVINMCVRVCVYIYIYIRIILSSTSRLPATRARLCCKCQDLRHFHSDPDNLR